MKRLKIIFFLVAAASLIAGYAMKAFMPEKKTDVAAHLRELFPGVQFVQGKGGLPHYTSGDGTVAFSTHDITPSIRGYAGPITVLLALSPNGKIRGIEILDHEETKNYVHYMESPEYLRGFLGKSIHDPFEVDNDINGISRATVSVEALAKTVRESSGRIAGEVLGIEVKTGTGRRSFSWGWLTYLPLFCFALSSYFLSRNNKRYLGMRDISLAAGIVVIGVYLASPFSVLHVLNLLLLQPSSSLLWIAVVATTVVSVAMAGRFYCGWLCPFGAIAEFIGRLPAKKWDIRVLTDDGGRDLKYIILALAACIVFLSRKPEFGNYETYVTLFSLHGSALSWTMVIISLVANLRVRRFWCRYLCPVAALTGLLSRKDPGYVSVPDCPMGNKPMPLISECIRCNRCYKKEAAGNGS